MMVDKCHKYLGTKCVLISCVNTLDIFILEEIYHVRPLTIILVHVWALFSISEEQKI